MNGQYFNPRETFKQRWKATCQHAFDEIIDKLTYAPILGFANPKLLFILHTDANTTGLGVAVYQEEEEKIRGLSFNENSNFLL